MEDGKVVRKILEAAQDGTTPLPVAISSSALPTGAATEQGLDDILAKLSADPATHTGQDELKTVLGEVQATPTSNTVLDRLKQIYTHLATIAGSISAGRQQADVRIDQTTPGSTNAIAVAPVRASGVLHRSAVVATDKCIVPTLVTKTTSPTGGLLVKSTTYYVAVAPGTSFGSAGASNVLSQATGADNPQTHSITLTIPQVVGAEHYDIFCSVDAAPKWIARITEAQRAAGDYQVQAYATVTTGGGNAAGTILLGTVGTGIQTTNAVFAANNAYVVPTPTAAIVCEGKSYVDLFIELTLTDLRSAPTLALMPLFKSGAADSAYYCGSPTTVPVMNGAIGQSKKMMYRIDVLDITDLIIAVGTISGQGASLDVWAEAV